MANYQQWSQSYFVNDTSRDDIVVADLTPEQHEINNEWFKSMLSMLTPDGQLYVPCLDKLFNKLGEEIDTHKLQPLAYYDYKVDVNTMVK